MATSNLSLNTLLTTDQLSAFPTAFNANMNILDEAFINRSVAYSAIDSITDNGIYLVTGTAGILIHKNYDSTNAEQVLKLKTEKQFKFRTKASGTWGSWYYPGDNSVAYSAIDSITDNGIYLVTGTAGILIHENYDSSNAEQILKLKTDKQFKFRTKTNGTWGDWHNPDGDLLWTNSDLSQSFAAQTVSLALSEYSRVRIQYVLQNTYGRHIASEHFVGTAGMMFSPTDQATHMMLMRPINVSTTGVEFADAKASTYDGISTDNTRLIPFKIYGIV